MLVVCCWFALGRSCSSEFVWWFALGVLEAPDAVGLPSVGVAPVSSAGATKVFGLDDDKFSAGTTVG